jgi:serine/threonine protein kinase
MSDEPTSDSRIFTDDLTVLPCEKCGCQIDISGLEPFTEIECPDCGHEQSIPTRLGQFLLLKLIGTGGMGGVYLARDETLGRNVAVKVMLRSLGEDVDFVTNFKREAQSAAKLNHPNIAQIYSFGQEKGQPYIVMELVSGLHFDKLIEQHGALDQVDVLKVIIEIAEGLRAADEAGLVHGDIKPENILLDNKDNAKLVDFGLASSSRKAPEQGGIWGTPYYIAPEKVRRKPADARSDIYSLGATLFHALSGHPPFDGETPVDVVRARLNAPAPKLKDVRPDIDERISDIVVRMLEAEPAQRYPTYASLLGDLRKVYDTLAPHGVRGRKLFGGLRGMSGPIPEATGATGSRRNKVIIKKGFAASLSTEKPRTQTVVPESEPKHKKPRKPMKWVKPVLWGVVVLLVLGGIGFGWYSMASAKARRVAAAEAERHIAEARTAARNLYPQAVAAQAGIAASISEAEAWVETVKENYQTVEGQPLVVPALGPVTVEPVETEAVSGETPSEAPAEEADAAESEASEAGAETPPAVAGAEALPPEAAADAEALPPEAADGGENAEAPPEPARTVTREDILSTDMSDIRRQSIEVVYDLDDMRALLLEANQVLDVCSNSLQQAESATELELITSAGNNLALEIEQLKNLQKKTEDLSARIAKGRDAVIAIKTAFLADEQKRRDEEARLAEQKRRDEEEAQRTAELRQKTEREIDLADSLLSDVMQTIEKNGFREGLAQLQRREADFETDPGKDRWSASVMRFEHLVALQGFVVEQLNKTPYKRGWIQQNPPTDIVGAERFGLRVRATQDTHRLVRWEEVSAFQFYKIVEFCIKEYQESSERDFGVLAARKLAFAVYCAALAPAYPDTDLGKTAVTLADQAVKMRPSLGPDRAKLIPDTLK